MLFVHTMQVTDFQNIFCSHTVLIALIFSTVYLYRSMVLLLTDHSLFTLWLNMTWEWLGFQSPVPTSSAHAPLQLVLNCTFL